MKKNLLIATSFVLASLFNSIASAAMQGPEPQICPSVASIRAVGVSRVVFQDNELFWVAGRRDQKYGTPNDWTFLIGRIVAANIDDAYQKATLGLNSLKLEIGPVTGPVGKWVCFYSTSQGYPAAAINPNIASNQFSLVLNH